MEKPTFEMEVDYPIIDANNKYKKGTARFLGFSRGTEMGFMEAVFRVTFEDGQTGNMGQTELYFIET